MKFIHTSDWHLGQDFYNYDRVVEQKAFLSQLSEIAAKEKPDALLIAGDIYHSPTPQNVTVQMYNEGLLAIHKACPEMKIIIIAGNHDSASKLSADSPVWSELDVTVVSQVKKDSDADQYIIPVADKGFVVAAPYTYKSNYPPKEGVDKEDRRKEWFRWVLKETEMKNTGNLPVVLMMHDSIIGCDYKGHDEKIVGGIQAADINELSKDENDSGYDYIALGHIHHPQTVKGTQEKAVYCGSPINVSFDEDYDHFINIVTIDERGGKSDIEKVRIENPIPVETVPSSPASIEDVITYIKKLDPDKPRYIRANVLRKKAESVAGYPDRINIALGDNTKIRYCCMVLTNEDGSDNQVELGSNIVTMTLDEFHDKGAMDMARLYYKQTLGEELPEEMESMLLEIINNVEE